VHVTVDLVSVPPGVALAEADDCTRFDVIVHGAGAGAGDSDDVGRALVDASVGRTEGSDALVDVGAVRRMAAGSVGESWEEDFLSMLDYARGRGWLTDDRESIRAHVEWR